MKHNIDLKDIMARKLLKNDEQYFQFQRDS